MNEGDAPQKFQVTPQVLIMAGVMFLMLALPLAVTAFFTLRGFQERREEAAEPLPAEVPALRESFESLVDDVWAPVAAPLDAEDARPVVTIVADDPEARAGEVMAEVQTRGGTALDSAQDDGSIRILATLSGPEAAAFLVAHGTDAGGVSGEGSVLVEVTVRREK